MAENSIGGVAKPEAANQNVGRISSKQGHRDIGERDFRYGEVIRHQMFVIQDDFNHIAIKLQNAPPSQHELTKRCFAVVQLLEKMRHVMLSVGRGGPQVRRPDSRAEIPALRALTGPVDTGSRQP